MVVVDDGSTPPIEEREVTSRGARLIRHPVNLGAAAAATPDFPPAELPSWPLPTMTAGRPPSGPSHCSPPTSTRGWPQPVGRWWERPVPAVGSLLPSQPARHPPRSRIGTQHIGGLPAVALRSAQRLASHLRRREGCVLTGQRQHLLPTGRPRSSGWLRRQYRLRGEDDDICLRLRRAFPDHVLRLVPAAAMEHEYDPHLRDALRRASIYGNGNARNLRRHDGWGPATVYPIPVLCGIALLASVANRRWLLLALSLPLLLAPRWILNAFRSRSPESLAYAYIQLLQETFNNVGFVGGYLSREPL